MFRNRGKYLPGLSEGERTLIMEAMNALFLHTHTHTITILCTKILYIILFLRTSAICGFSRNPVPRILKYANHVKQSEEAWSWSPRKERGEDAEDSFDRRILRAISREKGSGCCSLEFQVALFFLFEVTIRQKCTRQCTYLQHDLRHGILSSPALPLQRAAHDWRRF